MEFKGLNNPYFFRSFKGDALIRACTVHKHYNVVNLGKEGWAFLFVGFPNRLVWE